MLKKSGPFSKIFFIALAVGFLSVPYFFNVSADADLWGHTRVGLDNIKNAGLARVDSYSFARKGVHPWIDHEWLAEVIFGYSFLLGGEQGLWLVRTFIFCALMGCLTALYWSRWPEPIPVLLAVIFTLPFISVFTNVRPHGFTFLFLALVLICIEAYRRGHKRHIYALPFLMVLWVNLHGGFVLGIGVISAGFLFLTLGREGLPAAPSLTEKKKLLVTFIATLLATLLNPYGVGLFPYLLTELSAKHASITEWQPIAADQWPFYLFFLLVPSLLLIVSGAWQRTTQTVFYFITAIAAYQRSRFFIFFTIFAALVLLDSAHSLWLRRLSKRSDPLLSPFSRFLILLSLYVSIIVSTCLSLPSDIRHGGAHVLVDAKKYPLAAIQFLSGHKLGPNLVLPYDWGEFAMWHLSPNYKVILDGRNVTVYSAAYIDDIVDALGKGDVESLSMHGPVDVILVSKGSHLDKALSLTGAWKEVYRDSIAAVYAPKEKTAVILPGAVSSGKLSPYFPGMT